MSTWIPSAEAFGSPAQVLILGATGVPSGEGFGGASITHSSVTLLQPVGIPSSETPGQAEQAFLLGPGGIPSRAAFGSTVVNTTVLSLICAGTTRGQGHLTLGEILLSGVFLGSGTLGPATAILQCLASGTAYGRGTLLWSGPSPARGTGTLRGGIVLTVYPPPICCPCRTAPKQFRWGQVLTNGDLTFSLCDGSGNPFSPQVISYAFYKTMPGGQYKQLVGPPTRHPVMANVGCYYATGVMSCGQPGDWVIVWTYQRFWWSQPECISEPFQVLDAVLAGGADPTPRCKKFGWD